MGKKGKRKSRKSKRGFKRFKKKTGRAFGSKSVDRKWKKRARRRSNAIDRILDAKKFGSTADLIEVTGDSGKCPVYVQPIRKKCPAQKEPASVINVKQELQICKAEKDSLKARIKKIEKESIPIDVVKDSLDSVFAQYSKLLKKYSRLQNNSLECQSAYDERTQELKNTSEKYLTDLSKCNAHLKAFYDEHIAANDEDAIYKEETNTLKNMIQNSKNTLMWTFLLLIILIIACVLKKIKII